MADVAGTNVIIFGAAAATLSAFLGSDTIVAGSGALTIDAAGDATASPPIAANPNAIAVQGGSGTLIFLAGSGDATVTGSTGATTIRGGHPAVGSDTVGTLSLVQNGPTTIIPGNNPISISTNGAPIDVYSGDTGSGFCRFNPGSGDTLAITFDSVDQYVVVTDTATGLVTQIGDGFGQDTGGGLYTTSLVTPTITALSLAGQPPSTPSLTSDAPLPIVIGVATPYSTVTITEGATTLGTAIADAGGSFAVQITAALTDGLHNLVATSASGPTLGEPDGSSVPTQVTILPPPPVVLDFTDQTQIAENSGVTTDHAPLLSGTSPAGSSVVIYADGKQIGVTDANAAGWSFTPPSPLGDGTHAITAFDVDPASGLSSAASAPLTFTIVPVAPAITGLADAAGAPVGGSTVDQRPVLTGTTAAGTSVTIFADGGALGEAIVTGTDWSFAPSADLGDGAHSFMAVASDPASRTASAPSTAVSVTVLLGAPTLAAFDAAGPVLPGSTIADAVGSFGGTADLGASVAIFDGAALLGQVSVTGGIWSMPGLALADGQHALRAVATDAGGDQQASSAVLSFTVAPPAPVIAATASATTNQEPAIAGTTVAGSTVVILDNGTTLGAATMDGTSWSFTPGAAVGDGVHAFTAVATDTVSGVASAASTPVVVTVAPVSPIVSGFVDATGAHAGGATLDQTPVLTGSAPAGAAVTVYEDGVALGLATVEGTGWSYVPAASLGDGPHAITATALAGGATSAASVPFDITVIPGAPTLAGTVDSGGATTDPRPVLSGVADAGTTVTVSDGASVLGTAVTDGTSWSFTPADPLGDGHHSLTATATDAAGDSGAASVALAFDVVPAAPAITAPQGALGAATTTDQRAVISGTAPSGSAVAVYEDGVLLGSATVSGDAWSYAPVADLGDGAHLLTAIATDLASGEASAASSALALTVTPDAPTVAGFDDGSGLQISGATLDQTPLLSGTTGAGTQVVVFVDGVQVGQAAVTGTDWIFTPATGLGDGPHVVTAAAVDPATLATSPQSAGVDFIVTPQAPSVLTLSDTTGLLAPGASTPDQRPVFAGATDPGTQVSVYDGGALLGQAIVSGNSWSFTPSGPLAAGAHSITAIAVDGDSSAASATLPFTVDPQPPVITALANASNAATADKEPVILGTAAAGSIVAVFDGATRLGSTHADESGSWQFAPGDPLSDGAHSITAAITDASGALASLPSVPLAIEILPGAPSVTTLDGGVPMAPGLSSATTANLSPVLSGTSEPGTVVSVYDGSRLLGQTETVGASGTWRFAPQAALAAGLHAITTSASIDGLTSSASSLSLLVDPPPAVGSQASSDPFGGAILQSIASLLGTGSGSSDIVYTQPGQTPPEPATGQVMGVSIGDVDAGSQIALPTGTQLLSDVSSGPVTVTGAGGAAQVVVATGSGGLTYYTGGGSGVVMADRSTGSNLIVTPTSGGGQFVVATGSGNDEIVARSGDTSLSGGAGANLFFLGSGRSLVESAGADTVVAGAGAATVVGGIDPASADPTVLLFGGSGDLTFYEQTGNSTVSGGSGSETVTGGSGHALLFGGAAGHNFEVSGSGSSTLLGGGSGDVLIATGSGNDILAAEGDNATLSGGTSTGNNVYFGGSGHTLIGAGEGNDTLVGGSGQSTMFAGAGNDFVFGAAGGGVIAAGSGNSSLIGGGGSEFYAFFNGRAGGTVDIFHFNAQTDHVTFEGYDQTQIAADVKAQLSLSGSTYLSLADGTKVFFIGLSHLSMNNVV